MRAGKKRKQVVKVLLYPSEDVTGCWVAHCLDWDLVGTGDHPLQAFDELLEVVEFQIEAWYELGKDAVYPEPAPKVYWRAWDSGLDMGFHDISGLLKNILDRREARRAPRKLPERCQLSVLQDRKPLVAAMV